MVGQRSQRRTLACATGVIMLALVSGCSGGNGAKSSSAGGDMQANSAASAAGVANGEPSRVPTTAGVATASTPSVDRVDVVTATMSVTTRQVDTAADRVAAVASANGGRVDGDQRSAGDGERTASVTVRVPPGRLLTVMTAVDRLGKETGRTLSRDDVTTSKADIDARALALSTSVTRLQHLLSTAGGVGTLLQVEKVLTSRQGDLDSLRARQRALNDQIAMSTLTVTLRATAAPVKAKPAHHFHATGFGAAVGKSIHGLGVAITVAVAAVGYALPFAVPVVLIAVAVLFLRRRRRPTEPTGAAASPDAA
jgi:Domain of unknown function (DUF4349)